jgi:IMP dehydrogenase/GMP reductase
MIEVRGKGESLRLQGAIGLDVIHKGCSAKRHQQPGEKPR